MPDQASESSRVQHIYGGTGGRGGRGGAMGGAGGSGEGPILDSQYDIKTETFHMNNHWHLNCDGAVLDRFLRQIADSGGRGDFGLDFPRRPQSFAGFADNTTVAAVSMLIPKPSFDSLVRGRLAAGYVHPTPLAPPEDATVPIAMPMPTPNRDSSTVPVPTSMRERKPTFDSPLQARLAADSAHPVPPSPPDPVPLLTSKPTFDSLVHECPGADYATTPLTMPMATPSIDCPIPERRAADSAHPPLPPAAARPTSPPVLDHTLTPPPHPPILPTHPHPVRSLLHSLGLRRKRKPCLSAAISSVMDAAVIPFMDLPVTSTSTLSHGPPTSNFSRPSSHRVRCP